MVRIGLFWRIRKREENHWSHALQGRKSQHGGSEVSKKGPIGVEPMTSRSAVECSTTELWTHEFRIKKRLLNTKYVSSPCAVIQWSDGSLVVSILGQFPSSFFRVNFYGALWYFDRIGPIVIIMGSYRSKRESFHHRFPILSYDTCAGPVVGPFDSHISVI